MAAGSRIVIMTSFHSSLCRNFRNSQASLVFLLPFQIAQPSVVASVLRATGPFGTGADVPLDLVRSGLHHTREYQSPLSNIAIRPLLISASLLCFSSAAKLIRL